MAVKLETSKAEDAYQRIKDLVVNARLRPGQQIQIGRLSKQLDIGMTPVREALSRLLAEDLISGVPNRGFFCKNLDVSELRGLYEFGFLLLKHSIESGLAADGSPGLFEGLHLAKIRSKASRTSSDEVAQMFASTFELISLRISLLSGNATITAAVENFSDRSHYMRIMDLTLSPGLESRVKEMDELVALLRAKDARKAVGRLKMIVTRKLARLPDLVKEGLARAFLEPQDGSVTRAEERVSRQSWVR